MKFGNFSLIVSAVLAASADASITRELLERGLMSDECESATEALSASNSALDLTTLGAKLDEEAAAKFSDPTGVCEIQVESNTATCTLSYNDLRATENYKTACEESKSSGLRRLRLLFYAARGNTTHHSLPFPQISRPLPDTLSCFLYLGNGK